MKLSQFNFNLPESLIASTPSKQRDESRLMVLDRKTGTIEHKIFKDLLGYFDDTTLVCKQCHYSCLNCNGTS